MALMQPILVKRCKITATLLFFLIARAFPHCTDEIVLNYFFLQSEMRKLICIARSADLLRPCVRKPFKIFGSLTTKENFNKKHVTRI